MPIRISVVAILIMITEAIIRVTQIVSGGRKGTTMQVLKLLQLVKMDISE